MQTHLPIPLEVVIKQISDSLEDVEWLLKTIEQQKGWLRFPPRLYDVIENLKIHDYPKLYENEAAIGVMLLKGLMSDDELKEFSQEFIDASDDERGEQVKSFQEVIGAYVDAFEFPDSAEAQQRAEETFSALPPEQQAESVRLNQHFIAAFLASFFECLSVMVHGEKLTALVSQAKQGDDQAFVKAVQIDRRVLTEIPFFRDRYERSQMEADQDFSDLLAYRLSNPPYRGRIRYKPLWLTFSTLDQFGWLDRLSYAELLDVCDQIGLDGHQCRIQSPKRRPPIISSTLN